VALILAIEHGKRVNRLVVCITVCYDRFDDDMLDFGHPLRWKSRRVEDLIVALEESLATGLSNSSQLTLEFRQGFIAPWASKEGKLNLRRDVEGDLKKSVINLFHCFGRKGRTQRAIEYYQDTLFHNATFADMISPDRPIIVINAVDLHRTLIPLCNIFAFCPDPPCRKHLF